MSGQPAVLGIDLGTSRLKALLCTPDGTVLGRGAAAYDIQTQAGGRAETDPAAWWHAVGAAVRDALAHAAGTGAVAQASQATGGASASAADVAGLAVAGQMHGVVLAGEHGGAQRPAILWLDGRASAEAAEYRRLPGYLRYALGNPPSPGMAGPILLWLSRHEPRSFRRARWMLQPKDWLRLRLTGDAATDPTDASGTLLFDIDRDEWALGVIQRLGIPGGLLPPLRQPAELAGRLTAGAAAHLGLRPGLPVAVGASDTAASLLAAGLPARGWGLLTLGTGGQWIVPVAARSPDPAGRTNLFRAVDTRAPLYRLAALQNVGATLDWVRNTLGATWDDLYATAARPWRDDAPLFLPYLAAERWGHAAGGAWTGLSLSHQKEDLLRAALEGVAFLLRAALEDLAAAGSAPQSVLIGGGGTEHAEWRRLLADVLRVPLHPAATSWLSAQGAALIAAVATGTLPGWDATVRSVSSDQAEVPPGQPRAAGPGAAAAQARYLRFRQAAP